MTSIAFHVPPEYTRSYDGRQSAWDKEAFTNMLREELRQLEPYNCARYRLPIGKTQEWIAAGRAVR